MSFEKRFGCKPEFISRSHGRVNLIGEHTDYNEGFVLPSLIPQVTVAYGGRRSDQKVVAVSQNMGEIKYNLGEEKLSKTWSDYIVGVTCILLRALYRVKGFNVYIQSTVPVGSGLSSSAAVCVAMMRLIRKLSSLPLKDDQIPQLCQSVENDFVGARVGIMDPTACTFAQKGHALFIDTRSMTIRNIPLPKESELLVINSGIAHRHVDGGYNTRRKECEAAAQKMGVPMLRDLTSKDLPRAEKKLPEVLYKRARHVITENERVLACVRAFERNNLALAGELFNKSHNSMRDDYEVSIVEVDALVKFLQEDKYIFGARLTGGGFGGSIVALTQKGAARRVGEIVLERYKEKTGSDATIVVP